MKHLTATLAILLVVGACERKQPKKEAQEAPVDQGGMTFTDPSTNTTVTTGDSVRLPDGWPPSVPIYPGAAVHSAMTSPGAQTVMFATRDPVAKVVDFYKTRAAMTVDADMDLGPQHIIVLKNPTVSVTLSLGQAGDETTVSLAVTD